MEVPLTSGTTVEIGIRLAPAIADEVRGWADGPHDGGLWERTDDAMWEMDLLGGAITVILVESGDVRSMVLIFDDSDAIHPVEDVDVSATDSDDAVHVTLRVDMGPWEGSQ